MALTISQRNFAERDYMDHHQELLLRGTEKGRAVYTILGSLLALILVSLLIAELSTKSAIFLVVGTLSWIVISFLLALQAEPRA